MRTISTAQNREVVLDGKKVLLFSSNNYLGLSDELSLQETVIKAIRTYGLGSGGSRLTTGNSDLHMQLEKELAYFKNTDACLCFNSGYTANLGIISALAHAQMTIFSDELNHASIIDACRLAKAKTIIYAHNNVDDLVEKIRANNTKNAIVVSDSVFSMDGDLAPLQDLASICREYNLLLMVDDAHATGVLGKKGEGSLEHFGLASCDVPIIMGTLSKALAGEGGFVCAASDLCEYLLQTARSFIYTTAPSPASIATALATLQFLKNNPNRVLSLHKNCQYFAKCLKDIGLDANAYTPIFPIVLGHEEIAVKASAYLLHKNLFVPAIRYPTVAKGQARLRITLMATHTKQDIDYLVYELNSGFSKSWKI